LNYELDTYLDALQHFPENCDVLQVAKGNAFLIKKDIFKNLMWYTLPDSNKQYPLSLERVAKIKSLNQQGIRPDELEPVELVSTKEVEKEPENVELVGQISLRTLEKAEKKKKQQHQQQRNQRPAQRPPGGGQQAGGQPNNQRNPNANQQRPQQRPGGGQQGGGNQQRNQQGNQQRPHNPNRNQQRPNNPNRNHRGPQSEGDGN
jgi:hypothetical protein